MSIDTFSEQKLNSRVFSHVECSSVDVELVTEDEYEVLVVYTSLRVRRSRSIRVDQGTIRNIRSVWEESDTFCQLSREA